MLVTDRNEYRLEQTEFYFFTLKIDLETGSLGLMWYGGFILSSWTEAPHFELLHSEYMTIFQVPRVQA